MQLKNIEDGFVELMNHLVQIKFKFKYLNLNLNIYTLFQSNHEYFDC
jgi:hypothetical protein